MSKLFFEVLPSLETDKNLREFFEEVEIQRIATVKGSNALRIYIESKRLIKK